VKVKQASVADVYLRFASACFRFRSAAFRFLFLASRVESECIAQAVSGMTTQPASSRSIIILIGTLRNFKLQITHVQLTKVVHAIRTVSSVFIFYSPVFTNAYCSKLVAISCKQLAIAQAAPIHVK
jgi:hypothetical protein